MLLTTNYQSVKEQGGGMQEKSLATHKIQIWPRVTKNSCYVNLIKLKLEFFNFFIMLNINIFSNY